MRGGSTTNKKYAKKMKEEKVWIQYECFFFLNFLCKSFHVHTKVHRQMYNHYTPGAGDSAKCL